MNRFKYLRQKNNFTMKYISSFLNIKYQQYQRYEKNVEPSISIYIELAKFYNTSIDYLCFLTDDPRPYS